MSSIPWQPQTPEVAEPAPGVSGEDIAEAADMIAAAADKLSGSAVPVDPVPEPSLVRGFLSWLHGLKDVQLLDIGDDPVTIGSLAVITAVVLTAFLLSRFIQRAMARGFDRRQLKDKGTLTVAQRLTHYVIMTIGVFVGFKAGHIDLTALFTAGAVFAVVVGFAMQNISENFVAGVILMIERSIKPGDILEIEGSVVRVVNMGIRATVVRSRDEEELIVPNSILVRSTVKNYTLADRVYRLRVRVGVTYSSDLDLVRQVLEKSAAEIPFRVPEREPRVLLWGFGSSSVDYDISVWIEDPWHAQRARSTFQEHIWKAFKEAGIVIAFPQLDVHFDERPEEALVKLAGER